MRCPKCNDKIESWGSSCYPQDGVSVECGNDNCDYELIIEVNHTIPEGINLRLVAEFAHQKIFGILEEKNGK